MDRAKVLAVDDDAPTRLLLRRVLQARGFEVREADGGAAALAAIAEEDFDVVLLDGGLPDLPGLEVLRRLRRDHRTATLPVVMLTGRTHPADRIEGLEAGASDYLTKPVDLEELVARVRAQVRGRQAWRTQVADVLHRRAALAGAMAAIPEDLAPEEIAGRVVTSMLDLDAVRSALFVHLTGPGEGRVLAGTHLDQLGLVPGQALPGPVVEAAQAETTTAESLIGRFTVISAQRAQRRFPSVVGDVLAVVLGLRKDPWGVLLVEAEPRPRSEGLRQVAAATADLVPVVERVLGAPLARRSTAAAGELQEIIETRAFTPHFQPIVSLADGGVVGFEALTRFHDGARPDLRFAQAGRVELGLALERVTLEAALAAGQQLPAGTFLSVNVSASFLVGGQLRDLFGRAGGRLLVLEVTEHEQVDDYDALAAVVGSLGPDVRISVDDAGSGWSSLRHVFALKPDFVKVDRGWVLDLDLDAARQALLLGIAQFAGLSGGTVVAEGIETGAELEAVRRIGIPLGQGFLLGHPEPVELHLDRRSVSLPGNGPPSLRGAPRAHDRG